MLFPQFHQRINQVVSGLKCSLCAEFPRGRWSLALLVHAAARSSRGVEATMPGHARAVPEEETELCCVLTFKPEQTPAAKGSRRLPAPFKSRFIFDYFYHYSAMWKETGRHLQLLMRRQQEGGAIRPNSEEETWFLK